MFIDDYDQKEFEDGLVRSLDGCFYIGIAGVVLALAFCIYLLLT